MVTLSALIVPILLSSVIVWVASSIIHMALPWHKGDYPKVPDEPRFRSAVGPLAIPPGDYLVPRCDSMAEMKSPEFKAKMTEGPVVMMTVMPNGIMGMGKALTLFPWLFTGEVARIQGFHSARRADLRSGAVVRAA